MSWAIGYDSNWKRDIGYGVPAVCDHPDCSEKIDRGLAYVCGGEPFGGEQGCGLYFCGKHLSYYDCGDEGEDITEQLCSQCGHAQLPFTAKPDTKEWIDWKLTHESWAQWRTKNVDWVKANSPPLPAKEKE